MEWLVRKADERNAWWDESSSLKGRSNCSVMTGDLWKATFEEVAMDVDVLALYRSSSGNAQ